MTKKEFLEAALGINLGETKLEKDSEKKQISAKEFLEAALGINLGDKTPKIEKVVKVEVTSKSTEEIQKDLCNIFGKHYEENIESDDPSENSECKGCECHECQCSAESGGETLAKCNEEGNEEEEEVGEERASFTEKLTVLLADEVYDLMKDKASIIEQLNETLEENIKLKTTLKDFAEQTLKLKEENEKLKQEKETLTAEIKSLAASYNSLAAFVTKFLGGRH